MRRHSSAAILAMAVLATLGLAGPAAAGDQVPFHGSFEGALTERIPLTPTTFHDRFDMTGTATHLGHFELVESAVVDFGIVPPTGTGTYTFVAANGDRLVAEVTGYSAPVEPGVVLITEHAVITGGTGRFAAATGSFTAQRLFNLVTLETIGSFEGTISNRRGR
jgi:hypothetical protein